MASAMDSDWLHLQYLKYSDNVHHSPVPSRACQECRRKKTKCDMRRPACSLCARIAAECTYPTTRKVNRSRAKPSVREAQSRIDHNLPHHHGPQPTERDLNFDLPFSIVPQDSDGMNTDSFLDTLLPDHPQYQFTFAGLDGFSFTGQHSPNVIDIDQPGSAISEPGNSSATNGVLPRSSTDNREGSQRAQSSGVMENVAMLECSPSLAEHLFELFFSRVQNFLPLLHRSKLYAQIFDFQFHPEKQLRIVDVSTALLLNSMFALSARFSEWDQFWSVGPKERGAQFFQKAQALLSQHAEDQEGPTLRMLQIRILLAYYELASGPSFQAWQATGICCRMAYSLSLHQTDRKSTRMNSPAAVADSEWVVHEEKRRAWWAVFQMDNFASIIACRPFNIDASRMDVLLPISDAAWISNQSPKSALLSSSGPSQIWKSLQGCENQDAYAWFLVCNALLRAAHQVFDKTDCAMADLKILQSALHCFALGLPPNFRLTSSNLMFDDHNYAEKNWVIHTMVLLQAAHTFLTLALELQVSTQGRNSQQYSISSNSTSTVNVPNPCVSYHRFVDICGPFINDQLRAVRLWSPDYVPFASPLITCALIGPASVQVAEKPYDGASAGSDTLRNLEAAISGLVLRRFSDYWPLATSMESQFNNAAYLDEVKANSQLKGLLESLISPTVMHTASLKKIPMTWVQGLVPSILRAGTW